MRHIPFFFIKGWSLFFLLLVAGRSRVDLPTLFLFLLISFLFSLGFLADMMWMPRYGNFQSAVVEGLGISLLLYAIPSLFPWVGFRFSLLQLTLIGLLILISEVFLHRRLIIKGFQHF